MRFPAFSRHSALSMACALASASSVCAYADDSVTTSISGYGTVGGTVTDNPTLQFRTSSTQFKGATEQLDVGLDSRLGVQGTVRFGDKFNVTAQTLAARKGDKDFDLGLEWLYGQMTLAPGLDARVGRVVLPTFMISDSRHVGYSLPWLHTANEVYILMPFTSLDGVQGQWRTSLGPASITTQVSYGRSDAQILTGLGPLTFNGKDLWNLSLSAELGNWTLRSAQTKATVPTVLGPISYNQQDSFLDLGLQYDNGQALVLTELVKRRQNQVPGLGIPLSRTTSYHVTAGWRFGDLTPMLRFAHVKNDGASVADLGNHATPGASLRYELMRNVALKLQWDRYDADNYLAFTNSDQSSSAKVNVIGFGADFVF
jgi:hypothetical protein